MKSFSKMKGKNWGDKVLQASDVTVAVVAVVTTVMTAGAASSFWAAVGHAALIGGTQTAYQGVRQGIAVNDFEANPDREQARNSKMMVASFAAQVVTAGVSHEVNSAQSLSAQANAIRMAGTNAVLQIGVAASGGADKKTLSQVAVLSSVSGYLQGVNIDGFERAVGEALVVGGGVLVSQAGLAYGNEKQRTTWLIVGNAVSSSAGSSAQATSSVLKTYLIHLYSLKNDGRGADNEQSARRGLVLSAFGDAVGSAMNYLLNHTALGQALFKFGKKVDAKIMEWVDDLTGRTKNMREMVGIFGSNASGGAETPHDQLRAAYERIKQFVGANITDLRDFKDTSGQPLATSQGILLRLDENTGTISLKEPVGLMQDSLPADLKLKTTSGAMLLKAAFEMRPGGLVMKEGLLFLGNEFYYVDEKAEYVSVKSLVESVAGVGSEVEKLAANARMLERILDTSVLTTNAMLEMVYRETGQDLYAKFAVAPDERDSQKYKLTSLRTELQVLGRALEYEDFGIIQKMLPGLKEEIAQIQEIQADSVLAMKGLKNFSGALKNLASEMKTLLPKLDVDEMRNQEIPLAGIAKNWIGSYTNEKGLIVLKARQTLLALDDLVKRGLVSPQVAILIGKGLADARDKLLASSANTVAHAAKVGVKSLVAHPKSEPLAMMDRSADYVLFDNWGKMAETSPKLTLAFAVAGYWGVLGAQAGCAVVGVLGFAGAALSSPVAMLAGYGTKKAAQYGFKKYGMNDEAAGFYAGLAGFAVGLAGNKLGQAKVMGQFKEWLGNSSLGRAYENTGAEDFMGGLEVIGKALHVPANKLVKILGESPVNAPSAVVQEARAVQSKALAFKNWLTPSASGASSGSVSAVPSPIIKYAALSDEQLMGMTPQKTYMRTERSYDKKVEVTRQENTENRTLFVLKVAEKILSKYDNSADIALKPMPVKAINIAQKGWEWLKEGTTPTVILKPLTYSMGW